jgi:hypothetical protein
MAGLWAKLFGDDKVVEKSFDLVDNAFYTDQEKAENKSNILKFYEPFKLAQRYIAMTFCPIYAFAWILTFLTELLAALWGNTVNLINVYALLKGDMAIMVIIILTFYFGGGALEGFIHRFKAKK